MTKRSGSVIPRGIPFAQIPHAITLDLEVTTAAFRVYALLMKLANSESRAWCGHRYLEDHLPMSRPTIAVAIRCLEETGWLVVHKEQQHHTYTIVVEQAKLDLNWSENFTSDESLPVKELDLTGNETSPELVKELAHIDNHDRQPETDTLAVPANRKIAWDFLTDARTFGLMALTATQKKRVGRLARELGAKIDAVNLEGYQQQWTDLMNRAAQWADHFPDATMTADAFEKHFELLGSPPLKRSKRETTRQQTRAALEVLTKGASSER